MSSAERRSSTASPVHPDIRVTTLSNGFTCWSLCHTRPPGMVALALHVCNGSLNEEHDERGMSHFLEHLAFQGTDHFPPGALVEFFDSLGTRLGLHHNASTDLEGTTFTLMLPDNADWIIDKGFQCLADFAYGMRLAPDAVEVERRVILEEMRARRSVSSRVRERVLSTLLSGSRVSQRHPLGTEEVVSGITPERLKAYYERWYRPDNATLLVVGDIDPDDVQCLLLEHFNDWQSVGEPVSSVDPEIRPLASPRGTVITDPEYKESDLRILTVHPFSVIRNVADFRSRLVDEMVVWLMNRRLGTSIRAEKAPFRDAQVSLVRLIRNWGVAGVKVAGSVDRTETMLRHLSSELESTRLHGFDSYEVDLARRHVVSMAKQSVINEPNRGADSLLQEMIRAAADGRPPMSPTQNQALLETLLPSVTTDELLDAFGAVFDPEALLVVAVVPESESPSLPHEDELLRIFHESPTKRRAPAGPTLYPRSLLRDVPISGEIAAAEEEPDLGILSVTLSNGVRAHIRSMDYKRSKVFVHLTLCGGRIRETAETMGVTAAAALAFSQPASDTLSSVEIGDWLTGKGLVLERSIEEDGVILRLSGDPDVLEEGLELVHLLLTRPAIEASALKWWQSQMEEYGSSQRLSLETRLAQESLRLLTGDDCRFRLITHEHALSITVAQAERWLRDLIDRAPVEMAVVGDIERARVLALVQRFIGSLPQRPVEDPSLDSLRRFEVQKGPLASTLQVETVEPRAAVTSGWRAAPWSATLDRQSLQMAEQVLTERLRKELREKRGMTYSAYCAFSTSRAFPQASHFSTAFYTPPERAQEAVAVSRALVQGLADEGPTELEMEVVRKQFADIVTRVQREPKYWCRVLSDFHYHRTQWADLKSLPARVARSSCEDLRKVLRKYIVDEGRFEVICLPCPSSTRSTE